MIAIFGIIISLIGFLGVIDPNTPIGKTISNKLKIRNQTIVGFQKYYTIVLKNLLFYFIFLLLFLLSFSIDFYTTISTLFSILYLPFFFIVWFGFTIRKKADKTFYYRTGILIIVLMISFFTSLQIAFNYIDQKLNDGTLTQKYKVVMKNKFLKRNLHFDEKNLSELISRYEKESKLTSIINIIFSYREKFDFKFDIASDIMSNDSLIYNNYINLAKELYSQKDYRSVYKNHIGNAIKVNQNLKPKPIYLFPVELMPKYISSKCIYVNAENFSKLAVGIKLIFSYYLLKLYSLLGYLGILITIPFLILISLILTMTISKYNSKYNLHSKNKYNLFPIFLSTFGLFLSLISIIQTP